MDDSKRNSERKCTLSFLTRVGHGFYSIRGTKGAERELDWGFLFKILVNEAGVDELSGGEVCYFLQGLGVTSSCERKGASKLLIEGAAEQGAGTAVTQDPLERLPPPTPAPRAPSPFHPEAHLA